MLEKGAPSRFTGHMNSNRIPEDINSLYRRNRKLCIASLCASNTPRCTLSCEAIFSHYQRQTPYSEVQVLGTIPLPTFSNRDQALLTLPISKEEIITKMRHTNKQSAPGPTGITFVNLNSTPIIDFLLVFFNTILRVKLVPSFWKRSKLTMIYKSGDKVLPSSWRPIAGQETTAKLFSGILADRLQLFVQTHSILPVWQRANTHTDGCHECNLLLDLARDHAKSVRSQLHLVWLDIHNAFGSVKRALMMKILRRFGLPPNFISIIQALYSENIQLYDDNHSFKTIPEIVGVKQGDPLSSLLFSLYLAPAMFAVMRLNRGFRIIDNYKLSVTAYADDSLLYAATYQDMITQLAVMVQTLQALGLQLNTRKCISLSLGISGNSLTNASTFSINGEEIPQITDEKFIK